MGSAGAIPMPRMIMRHVTCQSQIGFAVIRDLDELTAGVIENARHIPGLFENGEWRGCNQA